MKKPVKIILWILAVLVGGGLILLLSSPLWLGPLSAALANSIAPKITGTPFKVAKIHINPYTGSLRVEDFHLGNPEGYDAEDAVSVSKLSVDIKLLALLGNKLHVKNVDIIDPYASYIGNNGTNNIDAILANVKKNLNLKDEEDEEEDEEADKKQMKVVIDRFHVEGVKFKMGIMPTLPIPFPVTLHDLGTKDPEGKETDGVTMKDMGTELSSQLSSAFSKAGSGITGLFKSDAAAAAGDAVKNLGSGAVDAVKSLGSGAADALKSIGGSDAAKSAGEGASKAADAATDAAKSVGAGAANAAGKAADVATDAAKSVGEGAKNLLKGAGSLFGGGDKK
jgi:hypothetical protein